MECKNCGQTISPEREEAMKDKDGRVFCDMDCAFDFYIDFMRLSYIVLDDDEENSNDNDT